MKYHVNEAGNVNPCHASVNNCPVGASDEHFPDKQAARSFYEAKNSPFASALRKRAKIATALVGSTLAMTVVLTGCSVPKPESNFNKPETATASESSARDYLDETLKEIDTLAGEANDYLTENYPEGATGAPTIDETPTSDPNGVTWQGKPLQPTADEVTQAHAVLDEIPITNPLSGDGYNRDDFGSYDRVSGEVEQRDYPFLQFNEKGRASGGSFVDPYTGMSVEIVPGKQDDSDVEHIVSLKEAYVSQRFEGQLTPDQMNALTTDFDNLAIVSSSANRSKGHRDAGQWLPTYEPAQCTYVVSQINVKSKYSLTVDGPEYEAMKDVLDTRC